jgi:DNA-binding transcriptional LysR family regulator
VGGAYAELEEYGTGIAGQLRLGGGGTALAMLLAPAAARLRRSLPGLTVNLSEEEVDECIGLLLADRLDIGILVTTPDGPKLDDSRFEQHLLLREPMDLLVLATTRWPIRNLFDWRTRNTKPGSPPAIARIRASSFSLLARPPASHRASTTTRKAGSPRHPSWPMASACA